jgi:TolA-binding protein
MTVRGAFGIVLLLLAAAAAADDSEEKTIGSLEDRTFELRKGKVLSNSSDLARDSYRAFLELVSDDPALRAEAMRRLGDLELENSEAEQLSRNADAIDQASYDNAVTLYQRLLEAYPGFRRNDTVLYQLARAYEIGGRTDDALAVLNDLVARFPETPMIDEAQFRRGEMLFLRKRYNDAERAYQAVVDYGETSRYYEQSLYKLGWSQFKLAWHDDSLRPFFKLLDRKIGDIELGDGDDRLASLSRAEQELVDDTFRVLSISFSYMDGANSIDRFLDERGHPGYAYVIYMNLGDLYLDKERFVDAAAAYEAFVDHDPYHPKAPLLQVEVIEAYKRGGFPSLVLEGKKDFVERYGMDGQFWIRNSREENDIVAVHLKSNLNDLAQYYHAEAQKNGMRSDYQEAARWYRKYLAYFPGEPDTANTNFLLAEILYESGDFADAVVEYERTAYDYEVHEHSAEAGYAALLSYVEHEKILETDVKRTWHQQYLHSSLKFADYYPEHPESGAIMTMVAEDLFAQNQFDLAVAVGQAVIGKRPPVEPELARTAWTVVAHSQFDLENFSEAENAYYKLRAVTPAADADAQQEIKDRIASSIYKQGEQARDAGYLEAAVAHFTRLGTVVPDSPIRRTAEYDAAATLINMAAWGRATSVLEQYRRDFPGSEFADDITQKLAATYMESGRGIEAAAEFERMAVADSSSDDVRREALWKAAELYEVGDSSENEQRVLQNIVDRYPDPLAESIEARYRLLVLAEITGDSAQVTRRLQELVDADAGAQRTDRTRYLAATASIRLAEPLRKQFETAKLTQPLAESMKLKRSLMEEVIDAYTSAAEYGVAEVTTESTFRLAEVYEFFGRDLLASERPADLDADALEQYELLLEEQVYPFEEKAIDLYRTNTDRVPDGVWDAWVEKSFNRLAGLMPARYAKLERSEDVVTALY